MDFIYRLLVFIFRLLKFVSFFRLLVEEMVIVLVRRRAINSVRLDLKQISSCDAWLIG